MKRTVISVPPAPIGILGGSFDPVHLAHCAVARLAYEHCGLERVYFIPAFIPPHKQMTVTAPARHRSAMLQAAIAKDRAFQVWDGELRRKGLSYTVDTLRRLRTLHPASPLYFIIGSDNITEIITWKRYSEILGMVTLCIAHRPGYAMRVPRELKGAAMVTIPSPEWGISSTMIRKNLAAGLSGAYMLPDGVCAYIKKHRLYGCER